MIGNTLLVLSRVDPSLPLPPFLIFPSRSLRSFLFAGCFCFCFCKLLKWRRPQEAVVPERKLGRYIYVFTSALVEGKGGGTEDHHGYSGALRRITSAR
jgi:hypothetical protein